MLSTALQRLLQSNLNSSEGTLRTIDVCHEAPLTGWPAARKRKVAHSRMQAGSADIRHFRRSPRWIIEAVIVFLLRLTRRWRRPARDAAVPLRILVIRLDGLGDLILTLPLLTELKKHFQNSFCTVLVQSSFVPLLESDARVDRVIGRVASPKKGPALWKGLYSAYLTYRTYLKDQRFDMVIAPRYGPDLHQATILALLVNAVQSIGYTSPWQFEPPFDLSLPSEGVKHEAERNLDVIRALGFAPGAPAPQIETSERDLLFARSLLAGQPSGVRIVALGLGSGHGEARQWPPAFFARALQIIGESASVVPIVLCSPSEVGLAEAFEAAYASPCLTLSSLNVRQASALLTLCQLFIGNDSGGAHLAAASGIPVLMISKHSEEGSSEDPANPERFRPLAKYGTVVRPKTAVPPCTVTCVSEAAHCITSNKPETVAREALQLLAAKMMQ